MRQWKVHHQDMAVWRRRRLRRWQVGRTRLWYVVWRYNSSWCLLLHCFQLFIDPLIGYFLELSASVISVALQLSMTSGLCHNWRNWLFTRKIFRVFPRSRFAGTCHFIYQIFSLSTFTAVILLSMLTDCREIQLELFLVRASAELTRCSIQLTTYNIDWH